MFLLLWITTNDYRNYLLYYPMWHAGYTPAYIFDIYNKGI